MGQYNFIERITKKRKGATDEGSSEERYHSKHFVDKYSQFAFTSNPRYGSFTQDCKNSNSDSGSVCLCVSPEWFENNVAQQPLLLTGEPRLPRAANGGILLVGLTDGKNGDNTLVTHGNHCPEDYTAVTDFEMCRIAGLSWRNLHRLHANDAVDIRYMAQNRAVPGCTMHGNGDSEASRVQFFELADALSPSSSSKLDCGSDEDQCVCVSGTWKMYYDVHKNDFTSLLNRNDIKVMNEQYPRQSRRALAGSKDPCYTSFNNINIDLDDKVSASFQIALTINTDEEK